MARIALTDAEVTNLNELARAVEARRAVPSCGDLGVRVAIAWLTWWSLALSNTRIEPNGAQSLPDWLLGPNFDTVYDWADKVFRLNICYTPSAVEVASFDAMIDWLESVSGARTKFNFTLASFLLGVAGLGLSAYLIWSKR